MGHKVLGSIGKGRNRLPFIPEVTPLLGIMGIAITGVASFCIYALITKNDVMIDHHSKVPPWEKTIDKTSPKLYNLHPIKPIAANIRNLKDEMNASE